MDTHTAIEELLEMVISMLSMPALYNQTILAVGSQ
jgi:hypothetical protein